MSIEVEPGSTRGVWSSRHEHVFGQVFAIGMAAESEAVDARNGWKRILSRCAPAKRRSGLALMTGATG